MACRFNPEPLAKFFNDKPRNEFESRTQLALFRDELIRILRALRVKTISGTITVSNLAVGETVDAVLDHNDTQVFCMCEYPIIEGPIGIEITVLALSTIDGVSYSTNGSQFVLRIKNASLADYSPTFQLDYTRRGFR